MKHFVVSLICFLNLGFLDAASLKRAEQNVLETIDATQLKLAKLDGELDVFSQFLAEAIQTHESIDAAGDDDEELHVNPLSSGPELSEPDPSETERKQELSSVGEESKEMAVFRRSLNTEDQALLKMYVSKRKLMRAVLAKKRGESVNGHSHIKRQTDLDEPELKDFIAQLPVDQQQLIEDHPSVADELLQAIHSPGATGEEGTATDKRSLPAQAHFKRQVELSDPRLQAYISNLSDDQQQLIEDHPSIAEDLLLALEAPVATGEVQEPAKRSTNVQVQHKRQSIFAPEVEAFIATLPDDQKQLIEDHPSEAGALLQALEQPGATGEEAGPNDQIAKRNLHEGDFKKLIQECLIHISALKLAVDTAAELQDVEPADTLEELTNKIAADIQEAKDKGIKPEELLAAFKDKFAKTKTA